MVNCRSEPLTVWAKTPWPMALAALSTSPSDQGVLVMGLLTTPAFKKAGLLTHLALGLSNVCVCFPSVSLGAMPLPWSGGLFTMT